MTTGVETALIAGLSAVFGGIIASGAALLGVDRQLRAQRRSSKRAEQLAVMAEWIEASLLYADEVEYLVAGRDDLLERGGQARLDAQRDEVDEINTRRRGSYARLSLVCSDDLLAWLGEAMSDTQAALDDAIRDAWESDDSDEREEKAGKAIGDFKFFLDDAMRRLRHELSQD